MWLLYAGASLSTAARIWIRVHRCGDKGESRLLKEPPPDGFAIVQSLCWTTAAILAITSFAFLGLRGRETGILVATAVMSLGVIWAVVDTIDRIRRYLNWRRTECHDTGRRLSITLRIDSALGRRW